MIWKSQLCWKSVFILTYHITLSAKVNSSLNRTAKKCTAEIGQYERLRRKDELGLVCSKLLISHCLVQFSSRTFHCNTNILLTAIICMRRLLGRTSFHSRRSCSLHVRLRSSPCLSRPRFCRLSRSASLTPLTTCPSYISRLLACLPILIYTRCSRRS